jgi:hypothetical protein
LKEQLVAVELGWKESPEKLEGDDGSTPIFDVLIHENIFELYSSISEQDKKREDILNGINQHQLFLNFWQLPMVDDLKILKCDRYNWFAGTNTHKMKIINKNIKKEFVGKYRMIQYEKNIHIYNEGSCSLGAL